MARGNRTYYNVYPRYSCGSPGLVDEATALRVAEDERTGYARHLDGTYGGTLKEYAERLGLARIVETIRERGHGWIVHDLLTDEEYYRPTADNIKTTHAEHPTGKRIEVTVIGPDEDDRYHSVLVRAVKPWEVDDWTNEGWSVPRHALTYITRRKTPTWRRKDGAKR